MTRWRPFVLGSLTVAVNEPSALTLAVPSRFAPVRNVTRSPRWETSARPRTVARPETRRMSRIVSWRPEHLRTGGFGVGVGGVAAGATTTTLRVALADPA